MKIFTKTAILLTFVLPNLLPALAPPTISFLHTSPAPYSVFHPEKTTITLISPQPIQTGTALIGSIEVVGAQSGELSGEVVLSDDLTRIIFKPYQPFHFGERVSVNVKPGIKTLSGEIIDGTAFHFTIREDPAGKGPSEQSQLNRLGNISPEIIQDSSITPSITANQYKTVPDDFPVYAVTVPANDTGEGFVFISNFTFDSVNPVPSYLLMIDNDGEPVYYQRFPIGMSAFDFKVQPTGWLSFYDPLISGFHILDSSYKTLNEVVAGNGYLTDGHEFLVLPNGHMLLMIYDYQIVDMTAYGGLPNATVVGLVIQELDTNNNVIFQWRSWDHLDVIPYTDSDVDLTATIVDYVHGNAIEVDHDGHLLVSARHLSSIIKINRFNGEVIWILGGKGNQFDFGMDKDFSYQHDIRRLANGNITIFDNNNLGPLPNYSRAVEYEIDEYAKTAAMVWEYRNTPDTYSVAMGSAQRLPNGNTVIGWGSGNPPTVTEVKPDGSKAFEITLGNNEVSYRAFRFPWEGHPTDPASLVYEIDGSTTTLYYSWNGATNIKSYKVFGGVTSSAMTLLTETPRTGFETNANINAWLNDYCYFKVMPVDNDDNETQYSNQVFLPSSVCHPMYLPIVSYQN